MAFERSWDITTGQPQDAWQRKWDELQRSQPLVEEDGGRREKAGLGAKARAERHEKWAYCFVSPDMLRGHPPAEVMAEFEDVLGEYIRDEDGATRLRIAFHPVMNRWCTFHMVRRPDLGEAGQLWQVVFIHMSDPRPGYLPADLNHDIARRHFTSLIGDYALPSKEDFEAIRKYGCRDPKLGTHMDRLNRLSAQELGKQAAIDAEMDDRGRDIADYTANHEIDMANQRAGTGWHMRSAFTDGLSTEAIKTKSAPEKFRRVQKNGYTVIERRERGEYERELAEWKERVDAFAAKQAEFRKKMGLPIPGSRTLFEVERTAEAAAPAEVGTELLGLPINDKQNVAGADAGSLVRRAAQLVGGK